MSNNFNILTKDTHDLSYAKLKTAHKKTTKN